MSDTQSVKIILHSEIKSDLLNNKLGKKYRINNTDINYLYNNPEKYYNLIYKLTKSCPIIFNTDVIYTMDQSYFDYIERLAEFGYDFYDDTKQTKDNNKDKPIYNIDTDDTDNTDNTDDTDDDEQHDYNDIPISILKSTKYLSLKEDIYNKFCIFDRLLFDENLKEIRFSNNVGYANDDERNDIIWITTYKIFNTFI